MILMSFNALWFSSTQNVLILIDSSQVDKRVICVSLFLFSF